MPKYIDQDIINVNNQIKHFKVIIEKNIYIDPGK